jgi:hypothetical protein
MLQSLSRSSLHLPNTIVDLCILRQSIDLGGRELEHALFARLRGQLLAYQHELLRGELGFAFDFLEELLEFFVGDCHFCLLDCLCRCLLLVVQLFGLL